MRFVRKLIDPIELIKVPLVVLALMFECDPRVETKEGREKRVATICCCRSDERRRNQAGHLRKGNGHSVLTCHPAREGCFQKWKAYQSLLDVPSPPRNLITRN
jgi:hypothetical protein